MDYSYIFRAAKIKIDSLKDAGFSTSDGKIYSLRLPESKMVCPGDEGKVPSAGT